MPPLRPVVQNDTVEVAYFNPRLEGLLLIGRSTLQAHYFALLAAGNLGCELALQSEEELLRREPFTG